MQPIFTIVMPCYNHGAFLRRAIKSVEDIKSVPCEIIIVDDGSTDEQTVKELAVLKNEGYNVVIQQNAGPGAARNRGISMAKGKYIVPLDSDDMVRAEYVTKAYSVFEQRPDIHAVYGDLQFFGGRTDVLKYGEFSLQGLLLNNTVGSCVIFRKEAWETVGGYDEELRKGLSWEDWDLWLNFAQHGYRFLYLNIIGYDYYFHSNSREREFLRDKTKVNKIITRFEEKYPGFYNPKSVHDNLVRQIKAHPLGLFYKIFVATYFPKHYQKLVASGKIRKYIF